MGRTVLLAVLTLLTLGGISAEEEKQVNSSVITDNETSESAPARLYRQAPGDVYANTRPHTSYAYKVYAAPQTASSRNVPVKTRNATPKVLQFDIRDSYGKFVQSPQHATYKPSYPQQFVRLQDLPPHLAQPLVSAASPSFQFKAVPNYFFGPQSYQVPQLHLSGSPATVTTLGRFSEPLVYAPDINNLSPGTIINLPAPQQQVSNDLQETKTSPKYQRLQEKPKKQELKSSKKLLHYHPKDIKHTPSKTLAKHLQEPLTSKVATVVNGKKTVVKIDTKPVLPLLDINLLEPLKFDTPFVPQLQHFLPKVSSATYHKLPTYSPKKEQKEFVINKVKTYDSNTTHKKKQAKPAAKPEIKVKGHPNSGDYFYEISTPNHQETYNEKVLKFNKETTSKPVEYSYNEQTHKEPEVYTYVHSSKEPLKVTHIEYSSDKDPKNNEYNNLKTEEQEGNNDNDSSRPPSQDSLENSGEDSDESEEEGAAPQSDSEERPRDTNYHTQHFETPSYSQNNEQNDSESPRKPIQQPVSYLLPTQQYQAKSVQKSPSQNYSPQPQQFYIKAQSPTPPSNQQINFSVNPQNSNPYQNLQFEITQDGFGGQGVVYSTPIPSHQLQVEHRAEHQKKPQQISQHQVNQDSPQYFSQPIIVQSSMQPFTPEYEEEIHILPVQKSHSLPIKVDPNQHVKVVPTVQTFLFNSSPAPQKQPQKNMPAFKPIPENTFKPNIYEKTRRVIIKEQEETPEEKHLHTEQIMAEMMDREENSEEDFEKAYKEAAFGFPAYEQVTEEIEKDIYNPETYGVLQNKYKIDDSYFKEYEKEGDKFPKSARLSYGDLKNNNQEDYYLDFAVHQPESFADRIKSKVNYYKMFKNNRPKEGKSEKLIFAPSYDFFSKAPKSAKQHKPSARYKVAPIKYEYDYSQEAPRDNSAYASRPYHKYRTHFVEPQFQYGFDPISAPIAAESEMAAVASNNSPESEKPGTRKKLYKENWYIKKTTTRSKPS